MNIWKQEQLTKEMIAGKLKVINNDIGKWPDRYKGKAAD